MKSIKLSQLRPRVTIEDFEKTFNEYNLVPSAVLVVFFEVKGWLWWSCGGSGVVVGLWCGCGWGAVEPVDVVLSWWG